MRETIIGPIWFIYVLFVVNYLHAREFKSESSKSIFYLILWCVSYFSMYAFVVFCDFSEIRDMYSPLCFIASFSAFCFFSSINIRMTKVIEIIAMSSFGTYLIQCNNNMWLIWNKEVFKYTSYASTPLFIIVVMASVLLYFILSMIVVVLKKHFLACYKKSK